MAVVPNKIAFGNWQFIVTDKAGFVLAIYSRPKMAYRFLCRHQHDRNMLVLVRGKETETGPPVHRSIEAPNYTLQRASRWSKEMKKRSADMAELRRRRKSMKERNLLMKPDSDEIDRIPF